MGQGVKSSGLPSDHSQCRSRIVILPGNLMASAARCANLDGVLRCSEMKG
jgi:hypothetical protein